MGKKQLTIYGSKNDHKSDEDGRTIGLTLAASLYLLKASKQLEDKVSPSSRIIPISQNAFKHAWNELITSSGINSKEGNAKLRIPEGKRGLEFKD